MIVPTLAVLAKPKPGRAPLFRSWRMQWIDRLDQNGWNFVIDELAWHLNAGRIPTEITVQTTPPSGVEFRFANAAPAFLRIDRHALAEHWPEAVQIIGGFPELGSVALRGSA